jgi:hypothetical protein
MPMPKKAISMLAAAALIVTAAPAFAKEAVPHKVGDCVTTAVKAIGTRLEGVSDSGSAITYTNGIYQVSYEAIIGVSASRVGDPIRLCLTGIPDECPPGDDRGKTYKATNLRTKKSWEAMDSEHMCGGA